MNLTLSEIKEQVDSLVEKHGGNTETNILGIPTHTFGERLLSFKTAESDENKELNAEVEKHIGDKEGLEEQLDSIKESLLNSEGELAKYRTIVLEYKSLMDKINCA